ncbi:SIMPL domain-containing protein [Patescibacteria group bacterium]|nr:SIMPL domain-containing protein [Patescibacteria group bacterium]
MKFFDRPLVIPTIIGGAALIIGLWIVGWGISARGQDDMITTTGSASQEAVADEATWVINLQRTSYGSSVAADSTHVSNDAAAIAEYFRKQNLASSTVTIAAVSVYQNYSSDQNAPLTYAINDSVTVTSSDVRTIDTMSRSIAALSAAVSSGTVVSPSQPQYFVSDLSSMRISLLGAAVKDAKARALQIAQNGGGKVGPLKTASSGVVQVLAPNSTNVEDYGQYDTSTIQKQIMVTVRASFYVR